MMSVEDFSRVPDMDPVRLIISHWETLSKLLVGLQSHLSLSYQTISLGERMWAHRTQVIRAVSLSD